MDGLNTNIKDYSDKEMEEMFDLVYPYRVEDIVEKKGELFKKIKGDVTITGETKNNITAFLDTVSHKLVNIITKGIEESHDKPMDSFNQEHNKVQEVGNHFIISNEKRRIEAFKANSKDGLNIGNAGGAPPGTLNPIQYTTIKRAVNIDSRFRPDYYKTSSSDQRLSLPYKFENVINMRLASIELPLTYYTISESYGNNTFVVEWAPDTSGIYQNAVQIKIPDGNYSTVYTDRLDMSSIEAIINAQLQNPNQKILKGTEPIVLDASFNLRYTVDSNSGRSIFAVDISGVTDLSNVVSSGYNSFRIIMGVGTDGSTDVTEPLPFFLGWNLGYRLNVYESGPGSVDASGNIMLPPAIVSEGICYIKGPQYMFVAVDDYNNNVNNYFVSAYADSINSKNILARLNLSSVLQSNGIYQTGEDDGFSTQVNRSRNYFGPVNIERLRITLYDEYGRIINLNNMDWSCALMFECMYSS
tara:strand:- start:1951 stop:3363 length:1413 start_codon:yes stop_codon:yes gene_type:complete